MGINPKIENYIKDLVKENYSLQLAIDKANKQTIPTLRKRMLGTLDLIGMALSRDRKDLLESLTKDFYRYFRRALLEIAKVYDKLLTIELNLKKIKGLRNGTIKEI